MLVVRSIVRQRALSEIWRRRGLRIGYVPTMGALHDGHMSLVRKSLRCCDRTVVSVFVNPKQFGPLENYARYPRPFGADRRLLERAGVHVLFAPRAAVMYPGGFASAVEVGGALTKGLCAAFRPGHFRGVTTVVAKLFNAVKPHVAYFGRKDAQQAAVIRRMTCDLDLGVRVDVLPTVREKGGLAMSSRNASLDPAERRAAPVLYRALCAGRDAIRRGARRAARVRAVMRRAIAVEPLVRVQYLAIVDAQTLKPLSRLKGEVLLAVAARLGSTRLIDNLSVRISTRA
jgi:pantoate--beta-alanine ligase